VTDVSLQGSCAGYDISSHLPFRTLRDIARGPSLRVGEIGTIDPVGDLLAEWEPREGNPFHGRLLRTSDGFAFWASDVGWYLVDPDEPAVTLAGVDQGLTLTGEVRMFGVPASLISLARGDLSVHAAAVEIGGRAVVMAGPSRYGKTTLAAAFAMAGHRLLSEDMAHFTLADGAAVFPGPAVMRLRPDVAEGIRVPGAAQVVTERDRTFVIMDGSRRGGGGPVPLATILFLREDAGRLEVKPVPTIEAIRDLWTLTFSLPTDASRAAVFQRVTDLVSRVPVLDLRREMSLETLPAVVSLVEELVVSGGRRLPLPSGTVSIP